MSSPENRQKGYFERFQLRVWRGFCVFASPSARQGIRSNQGAVAASCGPFGHPKKSRSPCHSPPQREGAQCYACGSGRYKGEPEAARLELEKPFPGVEHRIRTYSAPVAVLLRKPKLGIGETPALFPTSMEVDRGPFPEDSRLPNPSCPTLVSWKRR